LKRRP